eukprot:CAMPEP_0113463706 /NCGR_PEP_ID=MMETSP0014_2-20120614/12803_1 /TAXON_ID=2857 /ORGANISM="Nitzschia sp." /LENGTH=958 /DNA_ID=CAMNT_0000355723 /DNA_START=412 /DNA_END=3288 /DNA_ORIENTATION=- /assembly_acc=CAM_ASM_000159
MVSKILRRRGTHPGHTTTKTTTLVVDLHRRHHNKKDRTGAAATNISSSSSSSSSSVVSGNVVVLDWPKVGADNNKQQQQQQQRQDHRDETDGTGDEQCCDYDYHYYDDSIECYYLDPSGTDTDYDNNDHYYYSGDGDDGDHDHDTTNSNDNDLTNCNVKDQQRSTSTRDRRPEHEQQQEQQERAGKDEENDRILLDDGAFLDEKTSRDRPEMDSFKKKRKTKKVTNILRKKKETNHSSSPATTTPQPPPPPMASKNRFGWPMKRLFRGRNDSIANKNSNKNNNKTEEESREKLHLQNDNQHRERQDTVNFLSSQDDLDWSTAGDTTDGGIWTMLTTTMMTAIPSLLQKMSRINDSNYDRASYAAAVDSSNRDMAVGRTINILQSLVHVYVDEHIDDGDDDDHHDDDDGVSCLSDGLYSAWNDSSLRSIHSYRHHHPCHLSNSLRQKLSEPPTPKQSLECVLPNVLYFDDRNHADDDDDGDDDDNDDDLEDQSLSQKTDNNVDGRSYETITTKDKFRLLFPKYRDDEPRTKERVHDRFIGSDDGRNDVSDDSREPVTESRMDDDQLRPEMRSLATESPSISTSAANDTDQHQDERTVAASEVTMNTYFGGFNKATMDYAGQDLADKIEYMVYPQTDDGDDMNGTSSLLSFVWSRLVDIPTTFFWNQTANSDESNEDDTSLEISSAAGRDMDGEVDVDNDSKGMALDGFDLPSQVGSSQWSASENDSWRMSNGWLDWPSEVVTSIATELGARTTNMIGELDVPSCGVFFDIPNRVKHAIEKTFVGASVDERSDHESSSSTAVTNSSKMPVDSTHDKNVESITLSGQSSKTSTTLANDETISKSTADRITPPIDESSSDEPKSSSSSSTESSAVILDADDSTTKLDLGVAPMDKVSDPVSGDDDDGDDDDDDLIFEDTEELVLCDNDSTSLRSIWDDFDPVLMLKWWSLYPNNDDGDDGDY